MLKVLENLTVAELDALLNKGGEMANLETLTPFHAMDNPLVAELHKIIAAQHQVIERVRPCEVAVRHICHIVRGNEKVRYHLGYGTQSFENLCDAMVALTGKPAEDVEAWILGNIDKL